MRKTEQSRDRRRNTLSLNNLFYTKNIILVLLHRNSSFLLGALCLAQLCAPYSEPLCEEGGRTRLQKWSHILGTLCKEVLQATWSRTMRISFKVVYFFSDKQHSRSG